MFSFLRNPRPPAATQPDPGIAYRLLRWPDTYDYDLRLPVLRALSRMSIGPLTEPLFVTRSGLDTRSARSLLRRLVSDGCVQELRFA
jgi:hypothetical protein